LIQFIFAGHYQSNLQALVYYITLPFLYLFSALPFRVLYVISDGIFFLIYTVIRYRKEVVLTNLRNAFPEKTPDEINHICRKFYGHLCDLMVETFKILTISRESMQRHCYFSPGAKALFDKLAGENKSSVMVMSHQGNWEWAGHPFSMLCKQKLNVIYHPLSNKYFDGLMLKMRTRFGTRMIPMKDTFREMVARRKELNITVFIADQTPHPENAYWTTFLNQDTPVFRGTEKIAVKMNYPVVYAQIRKQKRGYYEMFAEMLVEDPKTTADGEISELFTRRIERDIIAQPETWLWSHRRWKHTGPAAGAAV
jgi:Kdo2-lipid IVA lauroyltransferase/acyltransferase